MVKILKSINSRLKIAWQQNWIYFLIMCITVIIRWIPITCGNQICDEAINDISIGAFASALVAWLIDWRTANKEQHRNETYRTMLLIPFVTATANYMQQFCCRSAFMPPKMRSVKHNFLEWTEYYFQKCEGCPEGDENFFPITAEEMLEIVDEVHRTASDIENNIIWLRKENIISKEDMDNINKIDTNLQKYTVLCCTGKLLAHNIKVINQQLYSQLLEIKQLSPLCTVQYSYDFRLTSCIKSVEQVDSVD